MPDARIIAVILGTLIVWILMLFAFLGAILFIYQKRQHEFMLQIEKVKNDYDGEILKSQLEMQEHTLQHMARELHDNIGLRMTFAKLHMNTILLDVDPVYSKKIEYAVDMLTQALDDMRNLSKSLSLNLIRTDGLSRAIENQVDELRRTEKYNIDFRIKGSHDYLEEQKEIIIFRILQEAINNIIKHSAAKNITIEVDFNSKATALLIVDDGIGFDLEHMELKENHGSYLNGINNMKARALIIKANYSIQSRLGNGTKILLSIPQNDGDDE